VSRALRIRLPGGAVALWSPAAPAAVRAGAPWKEEIVDALAGRLSVDGRPLDREGVLDLPLIHFHALRLFVERRAEGREPAEYTCRNCETAFEVDPLDVLPEKHFEERLGDESLPGERSFDLPEPLRLRGAEAKTVVLRPVTVRESLSLREAIARPRGWKVTPAIVRAMGIVRLGDEVHGARLARALDRASDAAWNEVAAAFDSLAYPSAGVVPYFCEKCEARNDLVVPADRELHVEPAATPVGTGPFPMDADAFADAVERIGAEVFADRGVRGLVLVADAGTPPCDQGGEPLMGSYQVLQPDDTALRPDVTFEVSLFFQTFKRMWEEDGPYDVEAEIDETIDHEVEHHMGHLAGHDEQDEEEVEQIKRDLVATYGKKALAAGLAADFVGDVRRFVRTFWPVLVIGAAIVIAGVFLGR